ncbi:Uncharacterised protein [Mycobacteroides abscessus subsp. abscessus]|nr:Uncharacterised protein [Mycobacteroides abscessus subsp. abscessus]
MSKKDITPVPGLHRVEEITVNRKKLPLAVKVTGRHLGAVNYLVSLAAERGNKLATVTTLFNANGSLNSVVIAGIGGRVHRVKAGDYVFLNHGEDHIRTDTAEFYESYYKPTSL